MLRVLTFQVSQCQNNCIKVLNIFRTMSQQKLTSRVEAALIDLSGTLHVEDEAIGNAVPALAK